LPGAFIRYHQDPCCGGGRICAGRVTSAAAGAGPAPIDLAHLSIETLTATLTQATSPALRARAEDGVGEAVRRIEQQAANPYYRIRPGAPSLI
jgi:hypothetical protein